MRGAFTYTLDQSRTMYYIVNSCLVGTLIGWLIVQAEPLFLLIAFFLAARLLLFSDVKLQLYIMLFSVFFADWFWALGIISMQFTWLPDLILVVLTVKILMLKWVQRQVTRTPVDIPVILYVAWSVMSAIVNGQSPITMLIAFRLDLKFVLMFYLIVQMHPDERFFKRAFTIFMVLLMVQVPVAAVKMMFYGQGEEAIGTYAYHTGIPSTIIPLVAISIFSGFYFFEKSRLLYILGAMSFFAFAIIGGKRGFVFFSLILFSFIAWQAGFSKMKKTFSIAPFVLIGALACIRFVPSLRPALEDPGYLLEFTVSYSTGYSRETGEAMGRSSALKTAHTIATENPRNFMFGYGPGSISKSFMKKYEGKMLHKVPIMYGRSQWVTMAIENGYVGTWIYMAVFIPFFFVAHSVFRREEDPFWRSIAFAFKGICLTYLMGFFYGVIFRLDITSFLFWFLASMVYTRHLREDSAA